MSSKMACYKAPTIKIMLMVMIMLMSIMPVLAWSTNSFNDSTTNGNISLNYNSVTKYLKVPSTLTFLTSAQFNLSYSSGGTGGGTGLSITQTDWTSALNTSLLSYYTMNGVVTDYVGTNSGSWGGGANYTNGIINGGIGLSGTNNVGLGSSTIDLTNQPMTFNAWINISSVYAVGGFAPLIFASSANGYAWSLETGKIHFGKNAVDDVASTDSFTGTIGNWTMITTTYNGTGLYFYINGVSDSGNPHAYSSTFDAGVTYNLGWSGNTRYFNGTIDEVGVWTRALTPNEISQLYGGGGSGTANLSISVGGKSADSLFITNATDNNFTAQMVVDGLGNYVINSLSEFAIPGYLTCTPIGGYCYVPLTFALNGSGKIGYSALSFSSDGFVEDTQIYNATAVSASSQTFSINFTAQDSISSVILHYGNATYTPTLSSSGVNYLATATLSAPYAATSTPFTFYWTIGTNNGTVVTYRNSTSHVQTVSSLLMDNCGTFTKKILNFTMYDQDSQLPINGTIELSMGLFDSNSNLQIATYNTSYTYVAGISQALVCISNATDGYIDYLTKFYSNSSYFQQYKAGQHIPYSNSSALQDIKLYDLLTSSGGYAFKINIQSSDLSNIDNAIVDIQRQYIPQNQFISVESPLTGADGYTVGHLIEKTQTYNFVVSKDGVVLGTFNNYLVTCNNVLTGDCSVTLSLALKTADLNNYRNYGNVSIIYYLDKAARLITLNYLSTDNLAHNVSWNVLRGDNFGNTTICANSQVGVAGTLTCTVPSGYNYDTVYAEVYSDGTFISRATFNLGTDADAFGGTRVILGMLMYSTVVLLFLGHPVFIVIGAILGVIFATAFLLMSGGGLFSVGAVTLYFIIAGGIILFYLNKRTY